MGCAGARVLLRQLSVLVCCCALAAGSVAADSMFPNQTYSQKSPSGKIQVNLVPAEPYGEKGSGTAVDAESGRVLWTVDFYARRIMTLDDGVTLIRLGPWASDRKNLSDLAIAFYRNGKEIRRYLVKDLLRDPRRIQRTASHYFWEAREHFYSLSPNQKQLTLNLTDGSSYTFEVATGAIVKHSVSTRTRPDAR